MQKSLKWNCATVGPQSMLYILAHYGTLISYCSFLTWCKVCIPPRFTTTNFLWSSSGSRIFCLQPIVSNGLPKSHAYALGRIALALSLYLSACRVSMCSQCTTDTFFFCFDFSLLTIFLSFDFGFTFILKGFHFPGFFQIKPVKNLGNLNISTANISLSIPVAPRSKISVVALPPHLKCSCTK